MKILLSTTKTFKKNLTKDELYLPIFIEKVTTLVSKMKKMTAFELSGMQKTNSKISNYSYENWHNFKVDKFGTPAALAFDGIGFKSIEINKFNIVNWAFFKKNTFILSALYGILRPLDSIYPYRLDFEDKTERYVGINLYEYWQKDINDAVFKKNEIILSLCSDEFNKILSKQYYKCIFKGINSDGKLLNKPTLSKQARGWMMNYIVTNNIEEIEKLKSFNTNEFKFYSMENNTLLFVKEF